MITNIPCVILSGGKSSRMGEDKSLLCFKNSKTLIQYQYEKLSKIFTNVYISTKIDKFNFNANLILDTNKTIFSPMIALQSIFNKLSEEKIFIITVDTPLVLESTINKLIDSSNNFDVTIAANSDKQHNLCGVFNKSLINNIDNLINNDIHKINYLIKQTNNYKEVCFDNQEQFINLNTIEDYKKAIIISKSYI
ncbi:MAG: molybdenum cofactor guanylyltransferase MobA [Campylobacterota bacterium]|nr:molybdenum cofactor guanylyltransferase MobA [Campylobacterota bacterium]